MTYNLQGIIWFPSRGLNTAQPPHMVPMDMASDGFDFIIDQASIVSKRDGFTTVNTTAVSATPSLNSLSTLSLSSGTIHEVVGTSNGDIWEDSSGTITTKLFSGLSTTKRAEYTQFLDTLIIADGTNVLNTWTGTVTGQITAAATGAAFVETHLNKLFVAGISVNLSRVDYSATGDLNTWTGAGTDQFNVERNNGQDITGIKSYARNELVIFKERSMFKLIGFDKPSFNLISVDKTIGCVASNSIQNFKASTRGGILIFAARDGLYVYDGSQARKVTSYIQDFWDTINAGRFDEMDSTLDIDNGRYILIVSIGSDTTHSRKIVLDLLHPWEDENGLHFPVMIWRVSAESIHVEVDSSNVQRIVFGTSDGFKMNYGTIFSDNGSSIDSYTVTPLMAFNNGISTSDCLRRATTAWISTAGEVTVSTEIKDGTDWIDQETITTTGAGAAIGIDFQIGISAIGVPTATFTHNSNIQARSRRIKIRFKQDSATRSYNLQAPVEFYYKPGPIS